MDNVTVKPLEWGKTSYGTPEAITVVGVYRLNDAWSGGWSVTIQRDVLRDSDGCTNFATIEAAKAAAQSDYEARILSALSVPPVKNPVLGAVLGNNSQPLTPSHLANALDAFWNAAIGSMRDDTYHMVDNTVPTVVVNSIAAGVAAVAEQLRKS